MRTENDIIDLHITLHSRVSIDLERLEEDPIWQTYHQGPEPMQVRLHRYLQDLLMADPVLEKACFTNGPASPMYAEVNMAEGNPV